MTQEDTLQLLLYVAGDAPSSRTARQFLEDCVGPASPNLEVVDVLRDPARALDARLLATPTLIVTDGDTTHRFVGDLAERQDLKRLLNALCH